MTKYFDAHCHIINQTPIPKSIGAICNATTQSDWQSVIDQSARQTNIWGAIGIHPWYIDNIKNTWARDLKKVLIDNPELMIGECGIDKNKNNLDKQIEIFQTHLAIAHELRRGIHVHCVGAWDVMMRILKQNQKCLPPFIMFHKYSGNPADIDRLSNEYNAYFSYHVNASARRVQATPKDKILIETDSDSPQNIAEHVKIFTQKFGNFDFTGNTIRMLENGKTEQNKITV